MGVIRFFSVVVLVMGFFVFGIGVYYLGLFCCCCYVMVVDYYRINSFFLEDLRISLEKSIDFLERDLFI